MAPISGSSHTFQKLKLDTSAPYKPVASSFATIPRRHDSHDSQDTPLNDSTPSLLAQAAAAQSADSADDFHPNGIAIRHNDEGRNSGQFVPYDGATSGSGEDIETNFRKRTTSITFDREVTLDSGNRLSIEEPLPRFASQPNSIPNGSSGSDSSEQDYVEIAIDRRKHPLHHAGDPRYPLLQPSIDQLASQRAFTDQDHVASLTSETTISPVIEEVRTPLETPSEYLLSPIPASSPVEFPPFLIRRGGPQRSRSYRSELDGEGGVQRTSRRSSGRSGRSLSSMSPAASFLQRYKFSSEGPLKPTEPDDEGQGIGYHGEYIIGKQIGFGGFSVVKEVTTIDEGKRVVHAVKIVRKQLSDKSEIENEQIQTQFDHEVEIWRFLRHPYVLPLLRVYNSDFATFCITRLNKGGTLFDLIRDIRKQRKKGLAAKLVKRYTYQLASAMRYLHNDVLIVHRDIKLENCLVDMTVPNADQEGGDVLLCDFGMADFIVSDQRDGPDPQAAGVNQNIGPAETSTSVAGSLQYAAPELFNAPSALFSPSTDIWAFGVVVFALLTAQLPFNEGLDAKTTMKIRKGEWDVNLIREAEAAQDSGIEDAITLIQGCLSMDPEKRWTVNDILTCSWLEGCTSMYENKRRSWLVDS